ncbi:alpha/beta fold hydrolase [uncultured Lamprocystis sp.]|uniref:esterase/lipase family protein n=2 Tax=uncultured Lamprocystis sp. TaxID=543132 RepID=UPI0025FDF95B|nr:alpha/beta fold hydrolase [uncultured Lamprocystis sp.]
MRKESSQWRWRAAGAVIVIAASAALWTWWAEDHPREERRLRVLVHDHLEQWFPDQMATNDGWHGLHPRTAPGAAAAAHVVLVHGLDEPGTIWDDLIPALNAAGARVWEFRYPNDQGIDRDAAYLAEHWPTLPTDQPVVLVGHSMGGLVIRDFVSRWRHPVSLPTRVTGPPVRGVILGATPNHGSEWARLRVWLELRDQFHLGTDRRYSLFAALRDGTGEAKIDLRPGSDFLTELNARPWPQEVPVLLIGGVLLPPESQWRAGIAQAAADTQSAELGETLDAWWSSLADGLGDGVVTLESLALPEAAPPIIVEASHRGMFLRYLPGDPQPPAIPHVIAALHAWGHD